jgi:hypothetical protein
MYFLFNAYTIEFSLHILFIYYNSDADRPTLQAMTFIKSGIWYAAADLMHGPTNVCSAYVQVVCWKHDGIVYNGAIYDIVPPTQSWLTVPKP